MNKVATVKVRNKATGETGIVHGAELVPSYWRSLPAKGTSQLLRAFGESPMLQAIVNKIASSTASIEWVAKIRTPEGDAIPAPGHISEKLVNSGVPGLDGVQCRRLEQISIELVGESFALIERNGMRAPFRRWPVPSHWVRNTPSPVEEFFEINALGAAPFTAHRNDMIWHKDVDPFDPYRRGLGIARSLSDELSADEAAAKHSAASLANRARPDIIISGSKEAPLQEPAAKRLLEVWQQRFGGAENAGKPFVSFSPISVETLTPSFRELELTKLREFERDIVVTVFGVPPELLGILESSNRATIDAAEFLFSKYVLVPRLEARKATYNEQLAWQYDERLLIDYESPVSEDREFKQNVMASRPAAFTDDEVRDVAGFDALPEGEGDRRPGSGALPPSPPGQGTAPPVEDATRSASARRRVLKISEDDIGEIVAAFSRDLMTAVVRSNARAAVAEFGADALDEIGLEIAFDITNEPAVDFIERTAADRSNLINGTTEKRLRATLSEGVAAGELQSSLIERVLSVVSDASVARADAIARTETTRAAGFAVEEAMRQANITTKEWLAVQDDRTRDTHREMDGQQRLVGETFQSSSGDTAMYPGEFSNAGENINCRCVIVAVDSLPTAEERSATWHRKASQMERIEQTYTRQLRSAFRQQGEEVIAAIERKENQ